MSRSLPLLLAGLLAGCTATKSTVHLVQAEQALLLAEQAEAPEYAPYPWTLAEQFMLKAREEWAAADFGAAEALSREALEQAQAAEKQAKVADRTDTLDDVPDTAPLAHPASGAWDQPAPAGGTEDEQE